MAEDPGFLLVQAGLIGEDELRVAREARAQGGGTLGEHLVLSGVIDDDELTEVYASRLVIPRVGADDLAHIPRSVLRRIPPDMAAEFRVVPISSDGELNLTLAMSDPSDKHVVDEVAFFTGAYVVRAVATQLQIAWCLAHYYGVMTPLARARLVATDESTRAYADLDDDGDYGPTGRDITPLITPGSPWGAEVEPVEEEETGPARLPAVYRRHERRRTSELAPRSGTLDVAAPPREPERLPAVVVDDEELTGRREFAGTDDDDDDDGSPTQGSQVGEERTVVHRRTREPPILLDRPVSRGSGRRRQSSVPPPAGSADVLLLEHIKRRPPPQSTQTEPALGSGESVDSRGQASHDETSRGEPPSESAGENQTVRRQSKAERRGRRSRGQAAEPGPGQDQAAADSPATTAAAADSSSGQGAAGAEPLRDGISSTQEGAASARADDTESKSQMSGVTDGTSSGGSSGQRAGSTTGPQGGSSSSVDDGWDVDDGWGPPGSTIPPGILAGNPAGVAPDDDDDDEVAAVAAGLASAAHAVAPARARSSSGPALVPAPPPEPEPEPDPAVLAAEMERSSNRLLQTLRALERAPNRDEVVDLLLDHMGGAVKRRAFFAVKGGNLVAFRQQGSSIPGIGVAEMTLDEATTFGQVAQSRLPYRGRLAGPSAGEFVERALGGPGRGEVVIVPVAVRGRPVGLLYGDGPTARLVDEHQAVLGRAAGQALERILASRKS